MPCAIHGRQPSLPKGGSFLAPRLQGSTSEHDDREGCERREGQPNQNNQSNPSVGANQTSARASEQAQGDRCRETGDSTIARILTLRPNMRATKEEMLVRADRLPGPEQSEKSIQSQARTPPVYLVSDQLEKLPR